MDILIWIILIVIAVFFTVLMLIIEDYTEIRGFGLVLAIFDFILWAIVGITAIRLSQSFMVVISDVATEQITYYSNTWPLAFLFIFPSFFCVLMVLKKIPETWPQVVEKENE